MRQRRSWEASGVGNGFQYILFSFCYFNVRNNPIFFSFVRFQNQLDCKFGHDFKLKDVFEGSPLPHYASPFAELVFFL